MQRPEWWNGAWLYFNHVGVQNISYWAIGYIGIRRFHINFSWKKADNFWGRFGGGWNWMFGFRLGGKTLILHLLVADLSFGIEPKTVTLRPKS